MNMPSNYVGFFRTKYDPELFSRLTYQLETDHSKLAPLSRAILIDDAVWLSRAGLLDIQAALGLINYLSSELDFIVWKSAAVSLDVLDSLLLHSKIYPLYKVSFIKVLKIYVHSCGDFDNLVTSRLVCGWETSNFLYTLRIINRKLMQ